ncbi:prolyl oligopeptidase family serine peptidase [Sphingobium sp. AN641]|uniref:prolyl oligopeptidase family serine peptidase n=1 Tax=Sphingobium sp. AN641 TaxID=3133443 RepID=UPI0030C39117
MFATRGLAAWLLAMALAIMPAQTAWADPDAAQIDAGRRPALAYPDAPRIDLVEEHFGIRVADPYRWLEQDVRADPAVRDWVAAENRVTARFLSGLPARDVLKARMKALYDYGRYGLPRKAGNRYFYSYNKGLQNQAPLFVREGLAGAERLLVDPNGWSKDGATALAEWRPSPTGRYLLYAVQDSGSDWRTLRILDVDTGAILDERIEWVKFSDLSWDGKSAGFFYSRFAPPSAGLAHQTASDNQQLYYHRIGTPQAADRLVYATPDRPLLGHRGTVTDDGRWLVITSSQGTDPRHEVHVVALDGARPQPRPLVRGFDNEWRLVGNRGSTLWFLTDKGAPRGRLVSLDAARPRARPRQVVGERVEILAGGSLVGDRLILAYMDDAVTQAALFELDGRKVGDVPLPGIGTAAGFAGRDGDPETFFSFSGFTTPSTIYRFDTASGAVTLFARPRLAFAPDDFVTEQVHYPSRDGTAIPMFVIRKRSLAANAMPAPTILYGYGGFNISMTPGFSPARLAWLEQGGVYAIANLRGGGEFGRAWHEAGRRANKQNVFDDFIAAGEYLKAAGYTTADGLAVEGRSNGGLLVGAVVNQRPDLFAAALPAVGVMDMLRFDRFTAGRLWVDDYGSPAREEDFRLLHSYSPYHNIAGGRDYPAILVTTADTDDRVVPAHSFKYAAALQAGDLGDKPRLIRIDTRAGHGSGKPTDKLIEEYADSYAFAAHFTGLKIGAGEE